MKLTYNPTRRVSTADLFIACDPPIEFDVKASVKASWARLHRHWEDDGANDVEMACELLGQAFVSVTQGDETYKLGNKENVMELKEAIEAGSPGSGDEFIIDLLTSFAQNHYNFLARNSATLSGLSGQ